MTAWTLTPPRKLKSGQYRVKAFDCNHIWRWAKNYPTRADALKNMRADCDHAYQLASQPDYRYEFDVEYGVLARKWDNRRIIERVRIASEEWDGR